MKTWYIHTKITTRLIFNTTAVLKNKPVGSLKEVKLTKSSFIKSKKRKASAGNS